MIDRHTFNLSRRSVLRDGLGTLGNGVLSKLTRKEETDGSLDLPGRKGRFLVVTSELSSLEDVVKHVVLT